jgi:pimeloyl-ACP methyl ester carboxylesterase
MSDEPLDVFPRDEPGIRLKLHRYPGPGVSDAGTPVLLIHGASANHGTFTVVENGLASWLQQRGFDPWLLDWRGSSTVTDDPDTRELLLSSGSRFNFNTAAEFDVPGAIEVMRSKGGISGPIAVMGHCMGAAILAESIALGHLKDAGIDRVVLSALGLFYETAIDSRLKSEDRILERLAGASKPVGLIDPRVDVDPEDKDKFPFHEPKPQPQVNEMCNRLRFMYGMPYLHGRLKREIHELEHPKLAEQFGGIPLHMYIHAARNIRQGHASFYNKGNGHNEVFVSDTARSHFEQLKKVTLITGELNRLWHRNSIDLMHEWLCRGGPAFARRVEKKVFADYGHQDLLWGDEADTCVFPTIASGLRADADASKSRAARAYDRGTASTASAQ